MKNWGLSFGTMAATVFISVCAHVCARTYSTKMNPAHSDYV